MYQKHQTTRKTIENVSKTHQKHKKHTEIHQQCIKNTKKQTEIHQTCTKNTYFIIQQKHKKNIKKHKKS